MTISNNVYLQKLQEALTGLGFDPGPIDGKNGPKTRAAALLFAKGEAPTVPDNSPVPQHEPKGTAKSFDPDNKLSGVKSQLEMVVEEAARLSEIPFVVIEGLRTKERQAQLVKQGASKTMNSKHITGDAVDLWPLGADGKKLPSDAAFPRGSKEAKAADAALWAALRKISTAMKAAGVKSGVKITWGGDWKSFPDGPHFQLEA